MWSASCRGSISRGLLGNASRVTSVTRSTGVIGYKQLLPSKTLSQSCFFSSTSPVSSSPLDLFRDTVDRETRATQPVGRSWSVAELRRKSYEDLHKLWYVLYMERNMLLTEQQLSRRRQLIFPQPQRIKKVQKSMQAIKQVLGERKRQKISDYQASKLALALEDESDENIIEVSSKD